MKTCTRCEQPKPETEYHPHSTASDGLQPWCKQCQREKNRQDRMEERVQGDLMSAADYMDWKGFTVREKGVAEDASRLLHPDYTGDRTVLTTRTIGGGTKTGYVESHLPDAHWMRHCMVGKAAWKLEDERRNAEKRREVA